MTTLNELLDRTLPLNRKERYYTGTVLPAIVCGNDFAHLHRLSALLRTGPLDVRADPDDCTVLFFTEYGLSESAVGAARERFTELPAGKDTPDVVVLVTEPDPVLLAIEAKLYDRPSRNELVHQLTAQNQLLATLVAQLGAMLGRPVELSHTALLPAALAISVGDLGTPVITWEQVRETFADVAPRYFDSVLAAALQRYPELVSKSNGHQDNDLPGAELVRRYLDGGLAYPWMGRRYGGLRGPHIASDVETGAWRTVVYQCARHEVVGNSNWFAVRDFVDLLRSRGELPSVANETAAPAAF